MQNSIQTNDIDDLVERLCIQGIEKLQLYNLVTNQDCITSTEFGTSMANYYIGFKTMVNMLKVPPKASCSDIVSIEPEIFFLYMY